MTADELDRANAITLAAAECGARLIDQLTASGLPLPCVLIGLHAEAVARMAALVGGYKAGEMCDRAKARVAGLPAMGDLTAMDASATHPGGRA